MLIESAPEEQRPSPSRGPARRARGDTASPARPTSTLAAMRVRTAAARTQGSHFEAVSSMLAPARRSAGSITGRSVGTIMAVMSARCGESAEMAVPITNMAATLARPRREAVPMVSIDMPSITLQASARRKVRPSSTAAIPPRSAPRPRVTANQIHGVCWATARSCSGLWAKRAATTKKGTRSSLSAKSPTMSVSGPAARSRSTTQRTA